LIDFFHEGCAPLCSAAGALPLYPTDPKENPAFAGFSFGLIVFIENFSYRDEKKDI